MSSDHNDSIVTDITNSRTTNSSAMSGNDTSEKCNILRISLISHPRWKFCSLHGAFRARTSVKTLAHKYASGHKSA
jgi:hypothetical protein